MKAYSQINTLAIQKDIWHGLSLTDAAAKQICYLVSKNLIMLGIRISVKQSGCAGLSYKIEKVITPQLNDKIYEYNGAKLYISLKDLPFIDGTELDYIQEGLNHVFKLNNPNTKHLCGCGKSFSL